MERFIRFLDEAGKKLFSKGPQTPVYNPSFPVGGVTYTRVLSFSRTDVLQGVFLTSSVDAGNQALVLERSTDRHGQEWLVARRLTGDKNVPAGEVAFKANVTSKKRLSKKDSPFGELMSPIACYTGQGCLKRGSSKEPQWIPVQIMQFGPDNPILQGASLGVLWETPNKKHYMTTLRRINFLCQDKPPPERTINRGT